MAADIFAKIAQGEIPSHTVYEDAHVRAFLDINPKTPGHTLIIPKNQCENIFDIPLIDLQHITIAAKKLVPAIKKAVGAQGVNLIHSAGKAAQQDVFYFHLHIVPRFDDDTLNIWSHDTPARKDNLEEVAKKILQAQQNE